MAECIACGGKGIASNDNVCFPCSGTGIAKKSKKDADAPDTIPMKKKRKIKRRPPKPERPSIVKTKGGFDVSDKPKSKKVRSKVLHGDCVKLLPKAAKKVGGFDFIFADPPFNIGQDYPGYCDLQPEESFLKFTWEWVNAAYDALAPMGVLALHGPDYMADKYLVMGMERKWTRTAWINWHYRFGQHNANNWIDARCHCIIYAKGHGHTFNAEDVMVESDRASKYDDKRTRHTRNPGKRLPGTVWGVPSDGPNWGRIVGDNAERVPECPNQLPEVYLARLIKAYTNPGNTVCDPFGGSGTTATVATSLGRNAVTMDISEENVQIIKRRIKKGMVRSV